MASQHGELALIDLNVDQVIARSKIDCLGLEIQKSTDHRYIYLQDAYSLNVVCAETLQVIQRWHWLEQTDTGWVRCTADEADEEWIRKVDSGAIERLDLVEAVCELGDRWKAPSVM